MNIKGSGQRTKLPTGLRKNTIRFGSAGTGGRKATKQEPTKPLIEQDQKSGKSEATTSFVKTTETTSKQSDSGTNSSTSSGQTKDLTSSKKSDMKNTGPTGEELRTILWDTLKALKANKISPKTAVGVSQIAKQILSSVKAEKDSE